MVSSTNGKIGYQHTEKNKIETLSYTIHKKINSKYIKDLPIRPEIIKFIEENRDKNPDTGLKVQTTKINIGK